MQNIYAGLINVISCLMMLTVKIKFLILYFSASCNKCLHTGTPILPTVAQFCFRSLGICCAGCRYVCIPVYTHTHKYILPTALPMSSANNFCDIPLLTPFCKLFGCIQHRWDLGISCSTGTFGWSTTVTSSTSCFLSSFRRSPISDYLQDFITVILKLWHCSSAGDLHTCSCWLLGVPLHSCSNQKVKHCLTLLHHFRSTWNQCTAPWIYSLREGCCWGGASSWDRETVHLIGTTTGMEVGGTEGLRRSKKSHDNFLHFQLSIFFPSRTACCSMYNALHVPDLLNKPLFHPHAHFLYSESQNGWGWKGLLEVTITIQPPAQAGSPREA